MQPHNEIDCNSFLCTFTALYYFPFSANGLACFFNKRDNVYVRKYTQDIQTSDFLYVGAAPRRRHGCYGSAAGGVSTDYTCTLLEGDIESLTLMT